MYRQNLANIWRQWNSDAENAGHDNAEQENDGQDNEKLESDGCVNNGQDESYRWRLKGVCLTAHFIHARFVRDPVTCYIVGHYNIIIL